MLRPRLVIVLSLLSACASAPAPATVAPVAARRPPDVHGDPLSLMPRGAVAWVRLDAETARRSPHFENAMTVVTRLGVDLAMLRRELGVDVMQRATVAAVAIYMPPGTAPSAGWPVVYMRGEVDRAAVLASAREHASGAREESLSESGIAFTVVGQRAFVFPTADVVISMDRALVRRVGARLAGEDAHSLRTEPRFTALWRAAELDPQAPGTLDVATDLAAIRGRMRMDPRVPQQALLDAFVLRAQIPGEVTVRAAGEARDAAGATELVRTIETTTRQVSGQLAVRLLGLGRVLGEGIRVRAQERGVFLSLDAREDEARRLFRLGSVLEDLGG